MHYMPMIFRLCKIFVFIFLAAYTLVPIYSAYAATGTIDSVYKYAWSSATGWINFGPTNGNVQVSDSQLTGYIWSFNDGWINLNPTMGGVLNDGNGNLSGYAWGQNTGYINFSGVVINSSGKFTGSASGNVVGTINFDCANCSVITTWLPTAATPSVIVSGGGGSGPIFILPPTSTQVIPTASQTRTFLSTALERLRQLIQSILPGPTPSLPQINHPVTVPQIAPLAMNGAWNLISVNSLNRFLFAPLPPEFSMLMDKFPSLKKTFEEMGVTNSKDLLKLRGVQLTLPGLIESIGLLAQLNAATPSLKSLSPDLQSKMPTDVVFIRSSGQKLDFNTDLSLDESGHLSSRINVVAGTPLYLVIRPSKTASRVIGYLIFKSRNTSQNSEQNSFQKSFSFISSPDYRLAEINAINHYLSLDSQNIQKISTPDYQKIASQTSQKAGSGQKMVLLTFNYEDTGNGIYSADIQAPVVDGTYEVLTRIEYPDATATEISFIAVIDPEGYVYEQLPEGQVRIANATITLYWLNPQTQKYEVWPAGDYNQKNPQITDEQGNYAFLIPKGIYYLTVEAGGFKSFKGNTLKIQQGVSDIHIDIQLTKQSLYLNILRFFQSLFKK